MDESGPLEAPVVVSANHFRFSPGEVIGPRAVASRMLLWSLEGEGRVLVNGSSVPVLPGNLYVLPWKHMIRYNASQRDPFQLGAIHIIPWHNPEVVPEWRAAHGDNDPLFSSHIRRDAEWANFPTTTVISGPEASRLICLTETVVGYLESNTEDDTVMRAFATSLVAMLLSVGAQQPSSTAVPQSLRVMQEHIAAHLASDLGTEKLARLAGLSVSAAQRQFRHSLGRSPQQWVRETRLVWAAKTLKTSRLRVAEVARLAGFPDPLYFSRCFSTQYGQSPREYRKARPLL